MFFLNSLAFSLLCLCLAKLANGYDLIEQPIIDDQFGLKNLFRPIEQPKFNYPNNFNRNFNFNQNFNRNYNSNYNFNANYKDNYFDKAYDKPNYNKVARPKVTNNNFNNNYPNGNYLNNNLNGNLNGNLKGNLNGNLNGNLKSNYQNYQKTNFQKTNYQKSNYQKSNYQYAPNSNQNNQNNNRNNNQINNQINNNYLSGYQDKPEYFSYKTIEQMPFKNNDVQQKVDNEGEWDRVPLFVDKKTFDNHARKMKERMRKKQKLAGLKKYDEIRQLEKIRYRLQAVKVRVQEQIEELKNLEYRCRRKRLYFFDTLMRNTANILKAHEADIDSQLYRIDELCRDFVTIYDQIEQNKLQVKNQAMSFDYSYDTKRNDEENGLFYSGNTAYTGMRVQALSKEAIDERLKEPRKSLDQLQAHSDKLISTNKDRLDKIKIVVKDFKKEFKDKI